MLNLSHISFSIIKILVSPSKIALFFFFSSSVMYFVFFFHNNFWFFLTQHQQYLNVLFVFRCHSLFATIQLYHFFIVIFYCFNTTLSPCFFCNVWNYFIHTQEKNNFFLNHIKCFMIFECFFQSKLHKHFLIFIFSDQNYKFFIKL